MPELIIEYYIRFQVSGKTIVNNFLLIALISFLAEVWSYWKFMLLTLSTMTACP